MTSTTPSATRTWTSQSRSRSSLEAVSYTHLTVQKVLVAEIDTHEAGFVTGRLSNNTVVHFAGDASLIGKIVDVSLDAVSYTHLDVYKRQAFYRTKDKKAPHNAYTSGAKLNKTIGQLGYRTSYSDTYTGHFQFSKNTYVPAESDAKDAYKFYPSYTGLLYTSRCV